MFVLMIKVVVGPGLADFLDNHWAHYNIQTSQTGQSIADLTYNPTEQTSMKQIKK